MAKPIKGIPIISGEVAVRFYREMEKAEKYKPSEEELDKIKKNYEIMLSIIKKSGL